MFNPDPRRDPRRHHRDPRHGPGSVPFGFRELFGRGPGRHAIRRGEIRPIILATLAKRPMHGYEIIQDLEIQSGGRWRPSAGSVYPTLQQLADEGLVTSDEVDGRRTYTLTEEGRTAAAAAPGLPSWADRGGIDATGDLRQLAGAVMQVQRVGSPRARRETARILADARRQVYGLLADDEPADDAAAEPDAGDAETSPA